MAYTKLQAQNALAVTPSDTAAIVGPDSYSVNRGCVLYVGTGGALVVKTAGGDTVTFANVPDGTFLPVQVLQVLATGTDASDILALW